MPFEITQEPIFSQMPGMQHKLLRYMSISKFEHLINTETLYFSKASKFPDPNEGTYGAINNVLSPYLYCQHNESVGELREQLPSILKEVVYVNCWTLDDKESRRMWDEFVPGGQGIALKTTWQNLANSLGGKIPIVGGIVEYVDHKEIHISESNLFYPYAYKSLEFQHETELRLMALWLGNAEGGYQGLFPHSEDPLEVPVNLNLLIEEIILSPEISKDEANKIRALIVSCGMDVPVNLSELSGIH